MIYFLKGKIAIIEKEAVIIDVRDVGYEVLVSRPDHFKIGEEVFLYTYNVVREDENYLVGFLDEDERNIFISLIKVKGLGPKTVISALSATTPEDIKRAIASNNVVYLKKLPGIGPKAAAQIILDLKGELTGDKGDPKQYEELYDALRSLGFKKAEIEKVLPTINEPNATTEELIKIALARLSK